MLGGIPRTPAAATKAASASAGRRYLFIDCTRGYAVMLVIACHLAYAYPGLPYPIKRIATSGWFGVQLFFLASAVTLLMSWHAERARAGTNDVVAFFFRRVFRIAPAYFAAGFFYFWIIPPDGGCNFWHVLQSALFVNAWHPVWMPTISGAWVVVPGGWSISVEFAFYVLFPAFALFVTSLLRALLVVVVTIAFGIAANIVAFNMLSDTYSPVAVGNFLFFWFPNQASVFALGGVLFFLLKNRPEAKITRYSGRLALLGVGLFSTLTYFSFGHYLGDRQPIPAGLAACVPFMILVIGLSGGNRVFVNGVIGAIGQVSFSAYLLHFAVLRIFPFFACMFQTAATGIKAILAYALGFVCAIAITYCGARLSYQLIEQPMIGVGKRLIQRSMRRRVAA